MPRLVALAASSLGLSQAILLLLVFRVLHKESILEDLDLYYTFRNSFLAPPASLWVISIVCWYILRPVVRPPHLMAPPQPNAHRNNAGRPGTPFPDTSQRSYASVLNPGFTFRVPSLSSLVSARIKSTAARAPVVKYTSAAHDVFNTPELLAMILSNLPLCCHRSSMRVCRSFWQCARPDAEHHLSGIGEALGVKFSRSIESIDEDEGKELVKRQSTPFWQSLTPRFTWLLNLSFGHLWLANDSLEPCLAVEPFTIESIRGDLETRIVTVKFGLKAGDITDVLKLKGVKSWDAEKRAEFFSNRTVNQVRYSWQDVKFIKMPFAVRVEVAVDMREAMNAVSHGEGTCPVAGCQVGLYGVQHTFRDFAPEEATCGEVVAFLDRVEFDARSKAHSIMHRNDSRGGRYFLGPPSSIPPTMNPRYGRLYIPGSCFSETWRAHTGTALKDPDSDSMNGPLAGALPWSVTRRLTDREQAREGISILQSRRWWRRRRGFLDEDGGLMSLSWFP